MGKAIIASKRFQWRMAIFFIADTFPFNLKTEAFLIGLKNVFNLLSTIFL